MSGRLRTLLAIVTVLALLVVGAPAGAINGHSAQFPAEIDLPEGFFPEGITIGRGTTFFVGSLADGSIFRGDLRTGQGEVLTDPAGPFATIGIDVDKRNRIWVSGGPTGTARVYDGRNGSLLETYELTAPFGSFINDVIVTKGGAWFTDSGTQNSPDPDMFQFAGEPRLFKVPFGPGGKLPDAGAIEELTVDIPDVVFPNLNGIETTPDGRGLIVAHSSLGALFAVNPSNGSAQQIDTGVEFVSPDGLVRKGRILYVVEPGAAQVSAVRLDRRGTAGVVRSVIPVVGAESPTTADIFGRYLYVADARFFSMTGPYKVFQVPRR